MIYINDKLVIETNNQDEAEQRLKKYLQKEKLLLINEDKQPISEQEWRVILSNLSGVKYLYAESTCTVLKDFKEELNLYIKKVEQYVDDVRDTENYLNVNDGFIQVTEALMEFYRVSQFLQKDIIDRNIIHKIAEKAFIQAEMGNEEYVLDLIEYELLPFLQRYDNEIDGVLSNELFNK